MADITDLMNRILPPTNFAGPQVVQSVVTGAAAGTALFTSLPAADQPRGKVFVCFEATGNIVYVRFGPATSAATTAATGMAIQVGVPRIFYLDPTAHAFVDAFGAAGVLKWYVCSNIGERQRN